MVKILPKMQETQIQSLGWEDSLEKGMTTHSSILAWEIPWTVEPGGLQSMGSQRVGHDLATKRQAQLGKERSCWQKGEWSLAGVWRALQDAVRRWPGSPCRVWGM